jgi:hypothetical protein
VSFSDEERAELIGALTNAVLVADGLLEACRHLTKALEWKTPPTINRLPRPASTLIAGARMWTS